MAEVTAEQEEMMMRHVGGGLVGYLTRLREGHRPTFSGYDVYSGCSCGESPCAVPYLLLHIERWRASYDAKVQDFAAETLRNGTALAVVDRLLRHINAHQADLWNTQIDGYAPPEELEVLRAAHARVFGEVPA